VNIFSKYEPLATECYSTTQSKALRQTFPAITLLLRATMNWQLVSREVQIRALRTNLDQVIRRVSLQITLPTLMILVLPLCIASEPAAHDNSVSMSLDPPLRSSENIRKTLLPHRSRSTRTQAVFVVGPPGYLIILFNLQHLTTI